ncbi:MAG: ATP-dependent helicase [Thermonema sp.]|uniref:UvrD-helicase domain-containing protein n=1 Tax=Thermonema sp. TaxID=2231181 RepID=UPI0021DCFC10|nr:UvrD-helicase domain-containing protein [Thermonema sp.]GIV39029.1 MAG: ATP-dependent helicase [Thermonema sp.]
MNNPRKPLTILNASAGSGKTYNLALYFLRFVLKKENYKDARYFRHILAITFTNKATHEIRERVLKFLRILVHPRSEDEYKDAEKLREQLRNTPGIDCSPQYVSRVYHELLHHLDELHISTIDSFINRLGKAAAFDLMLPTRYELTTGVRESLDQVVDFLMLHVRDLSQEEQQGGSQQWMPIIEELKNFVKEEALAGDESWEKLLQGEKLKEAGKQLFDSTVLDIVEESRHALIKDKQSASLSELFQALKEKKKQAYEALKRDVEPLLQDLKERWEDIESLLQKEGIDRHQDLSNQNRAPRINAAKGFKALSELIEKVTQLKETLTSEQPDSKQLNEYVKSMTALSGIGSQLPPDKEWIKKSAKKSLRPEVQQEISRLAKEMENVHTEVCMHVLFQLTVIQSVQKLFIYFLMHHLLENTLSRNSKLYLGWLSLKLARYLTDNPMSPPQIYQQLGNIYKHFLIDEFQDTSITQWRILYPFLKESTSQGLESLIVGDPKQSIYEWRGGESQLLVNLTQAGPNANSADLAAEMLDFLGLDATQRPEVEAFLQSVQSHTLDKNFRSASRIVKFNNELFKAINKEQATNPFIMKAYTSVEQEPQQETESGEVVVTFVPGRNNQQILSNMVHIIHQYIQDKGFNYDDVTILCRKNDEVNQIVQQLNSLSKDKQDEHGKDLQAYAPGSLTIDRAHAVNFLVAFLKSLAQPANRLAKAEARFFYCLYCQALENEGKPPASESPIEHNTLQEIFGEVPEGADWDYYREKYTYLKTFGFEQLNGKNVYDIVLEVIEHFRLLKLKDEQAYVFRFLEVVHEFVHTEGQQLHAFVKYWDTLSEMPALQDVRQNAVQVMTLHKSKGLEFPVTIILLNWSITDSNRQHTLYVRLSDSGTASPLPYLFVTQNHSFLEKIKECGDDAIQGTLYKTFISRIIQEFTKTTQKEDLAALNLFYVACTRPKSSMNWLIPSKSSNSSNSSKSSSSKSIGDLIPKQYNEQCKKSDQAGKIPKQSEDASQENGQAAAYDEYSFAYLCGTPDEKNQYANNKKKQESEVITINYLPQD